MIEERRDLAMIHCSTSSSHLCSCLPLVWIHHFTALWTDPYHHMYCLPTSLALYPCTRHWRGGSTSLLNILLLWFVMGHRHSCSAVTSALSLLQLSLRTYKDSQSHSHASTPVHPASAPPRELAAPPLLCSRDHTHATFTYHLRQIKIFLNDFAIFLTHFAVLFSNMINLTFIWTAILAPLPETSHPVWVVLDCNNT